jgi:hypothetical protein
MPRFAMQCLTRSTSLREGVKDVLDLAVVRILILEPHLDDRTVSVHPNAQYVTRCNKLVLIAKILRRMKGSLSSNF